MKRLFNKFKVFLAMLWSGKFKSIFNLIKRRTYSDVSYYFFRSDLSLVYQATIPKSEISITLRPYRDSDYEHFKNLPLDDMLLNANIPTCYVAVTENDEPCFRQWFIESSENDKIQGFFRYNFPILKPDECIFERAYAVKKFRGLNLMPRVLYLMGLMAVEKGYKWGIACIPVHNTLSLKAAHKAHGIPYKLQVTKRRFFVRRTVYIDIPKRLKSQRPWLFSKDVN